MQFSKCRAPASDSHRTKDHARQVSFDNVLEDILADPKLCCVAEAMWFADSKHADRRHALFRCLLVGWRHRQAC